MAVVQPWPHDPTPVVHPHPTHPTHPHPHLQAKAEEVRLRKAAGAEGQ